MLSGFVGGGVKRGKKHCEEKYVHFKDPFFMAATFVSHFYFFSESAYCLMSSLPPPANS